jgi:hypothetical protein
MSSQSHPDYALTWHALDQMDARGVSQTAVSHALTYGRQTWTRGAKIFVIGRREVQRFRALGINLDPYEGIQVVTQPDGAILTVYRNRDLRGLRPARRSRQWRRGC